LAAARQPGDVRTIRGPDDFAARFAVSRETIERLVLYERLLRQWQKVVNLVAPSTLDRVWHRHFADSAQLVPLAPAGIRSWTDLGSGAGFPGLVAAMLLADTPSPRSRGEGRGAEKSPVRVTLIESNTRKCAFLREVTRQTGIAVEILSARVESVRIQVNLALPAVISARAVAPLDQLLALAAPLSPPGVVGLILKGKEAFKELRNAEKTWKFDVELVPSVTDRHGRVVVISNLERKAKD
jgi:16S rRNA (guanine527-N7)-methyltransferase